MTAKKAFLVGALIGIVFAALFGILDWLRPFSVDMNAWVDRTMFVVCPFYGLGFADFVRNQFALIVVTLIGNAALYGSVATLLSWLFQLARWTTTRGIR